MCASGLLVRQLSCGVGLRAARADARSTACVGWNGVGDARRSSQLLTHKVSGSRLAGHRARLSGKVNLI